MNYLGVGRLGATQSISVGSSSGTSTAVFGSQTRTIRIMATQPIAFLIGDAPSVSSTVINNTGATMPASVVEYFLVTPGQRFVSITTSTSAVVNVAELA